MFRRERIRFVSPYPPAECAARLAERVCHRDRGAYTSLFTAKPVVGRVSVSWIRLRKVTWLHNSFQSVLRATLSPAADGTLIEGAIGLHPFLWVMIAVWAAGMVSIDALFAIAKLTRPEPDDFPWAVVLAILPGVILCVTALVGGGRLLARGENAFLRQFLIDALDARELSDAQT